jgi:exodeoxyribonuclease V gamma subunit
MTIELFFSNQIEVLAEKLSANLSLELSELKNKFDPMIVIVPNQNMAKWLQLTLAKLQGILLLVRFDFMEKGLWNLMTELDQDLKALRLMDYKMRTLKLIQCLNGVTLDTPDLAPIADYLLDSCGNKRIDFAPRLWQLTQRLAVLFSEYEHYRYDMIHSWKKGKKAENSMERCQQYLYTSAFQADVNGHRTKTTTFVTLFDDVKKKLHYHRIPMEKVQSRTIHIFGMSQISNVYLDLMDRLSVCHSFYIYTLNPSQEFWEDVQTPKEIRRYQKKQVISQTIWEKKESEQPHFQNQVHPLLAAWGKPGRENIRQLCALTGYTFHACYRQTEPQNTVLQKLQNDILTLSGESRLRLNQDRSLQIFASPSKFREVETVYNTICYNLDTDETLKSTDIAILVPDMNLYKPVFDAVFNQSPKILSYNLVDSNAQSESLYGQAIIQILKLTQGRFTRKAVFELLLNPCFMQRWDIGVDEIRDWADWAEELNIFHTYSRNDPNVKDKSRKERFSWKQALQRLRLGRIMSLPDEDILQKRDYCDVMPFTNLASTNLEVLEKFCLVIETLHDQVQKLSKFSGHLLKWARLFASVCDVLIQVPNNNRGESIVQRSLFYGMEDLNAIFSQDSNPDKEKWNIELFKEYVLFLLKGISGGRGDYLTSGVTISALFPMRPIPFKIMFILGMEEGRFPGREVVSALDLRQKYRLLEDITLPERNCYLFLEMLLSVRRRLYLGYVARDLQKDRGMQPCSVINQLTDYIENTTLCDGEEFKIAHVPLKGNDSCYLNPDRITKWSDVLTNFSLADRVSVFRNHHYWTEFLKQASKEDIARIQPLMPILNTTKEPLESNDLRKQMITTRQLARFLIDPVKIGAQSHLGLYGPEASIEDLALKEDEPFYSIFPLDYTIRMETLRLWLDLNFRSEPLKLPFAPNLKIILEKIYESHAKQSAAPEGLYGQLDRRTILEKILATVKILSPLIDEIGLSTTLYRAIFWGTAEESGTDFLRKAPVLRLPPKEIVLNCIGYNGRQQQLSAEIHAVLNWVFKDKEGVWHALILTGSKQASSRLNRYLLAPLIAYLVCRSQHSSTLELDIHKIYFHLIYETKIQTFISSLTSSEATLALRNLIEAFGNQKDFYWLPFETVLKCRPNPLCMNKEQVTDHQRREFSGEMAVFFDDVDDYLIRRLAAPMTPSLFDMAEKRFRWIFNAVEQISTTS